MDIPEEGEEAPDFTLPRSGGGTLSLRELRGRKVVLYFYPQDDTPGCTKEACAFRDVQPRVEGAGAVVVGISPDDVPSHDRFIAKYGLPFVLVSDVDHAVAEAYGAWVEREAYGRRFMGIQRSTFLIDEEGRIARVWPKVRAEGHAAQVLAALDA
jgi:peroxiredoxin Q/BCP